MNASPLRVLFLCTGNSARSIMAEALINELGRGRVAGFSAGSHPRGQVHPVALELLERRRLTVQDLRSKSWLEFTRPGAPVLDHVVTVCDDAAAEPCPVWPGNPSQEHWSIPDPVAVPGADAEQRRAFESTIAELEARIHALLERLEFGRTSAEPG